MELKQYLKMSQQLVMTPQLQQAIKLLQLSRMELADTISKELLENPVLEADGEAMSSQEVDKLIEREFTPPEPGRPEGAEGQALGSDGSGSADDGGASQDSGPADTSSVTESLTGDHRADSEGETTREAGEEMNWESFVENYNEYSYSPGAGGVRMNDDEMPTLEQTLSGRTSLAEHLESQLHDLQVSEQDVAVATLIIGNLDTNGYLNPEVLAEIAEETGVELDEVEAVLEEVVHELEPLGVGARSVRECLLIQALKLFPNEDVVHAIIDRHLPNLETKHVQPIMRDLGIELDDISDAVQIITSLDPRPGRNFTAEDAQYITPDVFVFKDGDAYRVVLNEDGLPKLRISNFYQQQIKGGHATPKEKEFIQDKVRGAAWLIRSILQRQNTIRRVTESIMRFQLEFLEIGVEHLRPLILRDVADDIGMHESTVSRVTTNKYVHTPQGIFELKYFFNSRISSATGEDLASESVKQLIKQLVAVEDPKRPLSDQKLCKLLEDKGINIARRTVAKYREMMNIPSSSRRKKVF